MTKRTIGITILGATGTIGVNTLDVLARHPGRFHVVALTGHRNVRRLAEQCERFCPRYAVVTEGESAQQLRQELLARKVDTEVLEGAESLEFVSALPETDYVMAGIVGAAGLLPTLAAARAGKRVLLANKEALVMSGRLFMDEVVASGAELLPIDSEHNAVFQCMPPVFEGESAKLPDHLGVTRILLTASGGPFRDWTQEDLARVTPEQAVAHPNWVMGRKISVDSATMMNKGLEVIEACWLFHTSPETVEVVVHPQSVIHSMVAYNDGSVLAQLGNPDMRTPIAHALAWPERIDSGVQALNMFEVARLDFSKPDLMRFPCLRLAYEAFERGGTATAVLNAANEEAVEAFLNGRIAFTEIPRVIEDALAGASIVEAESIDAVLQADADARVLARECIRKSTYRQVSS